MSESWHPRKTEKDVAVARAGVAKYDRGWKYGAGTREHDHSKLAEGGEVLKPEQLFTNSIPASYVVWTDGTIYYADAQDTGLSSYSNTDAVLVIQSAIDAVYNNGGGKIFLKKGVYQCNNSITNKPNVSLIGEGINRTIIQGTSTWGGGPLINNQGSNTEVKDITFDGNNVVDTVYQQNTSASFPDIVNVLIKRCEFKNQVNGTWLFSVWDGYSNNWRVKNVWVEDCYFHDALSGGDIAAFSWVDGIFFYDNYVDTYTQAFNFYIVRDAVIRDNTFLNSQQDTSVSIHGQNIRFTDNTMDSYPVRVRPSSEWGVPGKNIVLRGNTILNSATQGIDVDAYGNDLEEIQVIDNYVDSATSYAIQVVSNSTTTYNITNSKISGNRLINSLTGIAIQYLVDSEVMDNHVAMNQRYGISFYDSHYNKVFSNTIKNNSQEAAGSYNGLRLVGGSDYLKVFGNHVYDDQTTHTQGYGVYFYNSDYHKIFDNYFTGNVNGALNSHPANTIVKDNRGYTTENSGTATFSGDAATTSFTIAHGLAETPTFYSVEEASADAGAAEIDYITVDATNITVYFKSAPASGTDNVVLSWRAEVR